MLTLPSNEWALLLLISYHANADGADVNAHCSNEKILGIVFLLSSFSAPQTCSWSNISFDVHSTTNAPLVLFGAIAAVFRDPHHMFATYAIPGICLQLSSIYCRVREWRTGHLYADESSQPLWIPIDVMYSHRLPPTLVPFSDLLIVVFNLQAHDFLVSL